MPTITKNTLINKKSLKQYKQYIEEVIHQQSMVNVINRGNFAAVYDMLEKGPMNIGTCITYLFFEAGIDPLANMYKIPNFYLAGSDIENFIIPEHISIIGNAAFFGCLNLKYVVMDNRIRTIEEDAFSSCHDLEQIIYHGTKAEWKAISKQDQWDDDTHRYIIQCTDGILQKES